VTRPPTPLPVADYSTHTKSTGLATAICFAFAVAGVSSDELLRLRTSYGKKSFGPRSDVGRSRSYSSVAPLNFCAPDRHFPPSVE